MTNKLNPIDKSKLIKIDGKLYVPESARTDLIQPNKLIPFYFAKVSVDKVLHDTPTMGVESYQAFRGDIYGPFKTKPEAESKIQSETTEYDYVSYENHSHVVTKIFPEESTQESLPKIHEYHYGTWDIEMGVPKATYPRHKTTKEQVQQFANYLFQMTREKTKEIKETKKGLIAIIKSETEKGPRTSLLSISLKPQPFVRFPEYSKYVEGHHGHMEIFSDQEDFPRFENHLETLNINLNALITHPRKKILTIKPLEIVLQSPYDLLQNSIKNNLII